MTSEMQSNLFILGIMSFFIAYRGFSIYETENGSNPAKDSRDKYIPYIPCLLLPFSILLTVFLNLIFYGPLETVKEALSMCFGIFVHISIYYLFLLFFLSFLRSRINARACSMLWLLPNFLYLMQTRTIFLTNPVWTLCISKQVMWGIFIIWFTIFAILMGHFIFSHLSFRARILRNAISVTDETILAVWKRELEQANRNDCSPDLYTSQAVTSPLSIGLFRSTTSVVLPNFSYTPEELALVFRHEIVHISREDSWAKFFFAFCNSICWFNPLMWMAMRKSAADLELSCDETVLQNSDDDTRRQYAALILNSSAHSQGFTTCLSASASAMRYRLKNIMKPRKRYSGALVIGLTFFLLCSSYGYLSLAYEAGNGTEVIYCSEGSKQYTLRRISISENSSITDFKCQDQETLQHYLSDLSLYSVQSSYRFDENEKLLTISYNAPGGIMSITLSDHLLELISPYVYGEGRTISRYYLPDGIDWEYLDTLLQTAK